MKLIDTFIMAGAVGFLIIGILQSMEFGVAASYWAFMLAVALLFTSWYRKRELEHRKQQENSKVNKMQRSANLNQKKKKKRK